MSDFVFAPPADSLPDIVIDLFAGGGGTSEGIKAFTGRDPDIAVNHDLEALALHGANHPATLHLCDDIRQVDVIALLRRPQFAGRRVGLLWASPDCKDHSKAKGGVPKDKNIRGLAWEVLRWVAAIRRATGAPPRTVALENVEEFADWGPLHRYGRRAGRVMKHRRKETFRLWKQNLESLGGVLEERELIAADYGAPTTRTRLYVVCQFDGDPVVWPKPTHVQRQKLKRQTDLFGSASLPTWRSAAEDVIDWTRPTLSIFGRKKDLAWKTERRIARGVDRFVIRAERPFIIPVTHVGDERSYDPADPLRTVTSGSGFAVSEVRLSGASVGVGGRAGQSPPRGLDDPVNTVTAKNDRAVVSAVLVPRYGEREGQEPRVLSVEAPAPTAVPDGKGCTQRLVGADLELWSAALHEIGAPLGSKRREVLAFLWTHFGTPTDEERADPVATLRGRLRFGLVVLDGVVWQIVDIGMRMLTPRELYKAQGFPADYVIEITLANGKPLTKTAQTRMAGNSVSPPVARAIIAANCPWLAEEEMAA